MGFCLSNYVPILLFHKEVIRRTGFFDERFVTGGYEDNDYYIRLRLANIASWITEDIDYVSSIKTLWNHEQSAIFFRKKYVIDAVNMKLHKFLPEEKYPYEIKTIGETPVIRKSQACTKQQSRSPEKIIPAFLLRSLLLASLCRWQ